MRTIELILILGFYYFDNGSKIESFTKRFNQYFNNDVGIQTILYSYSKFKNVDPSNNINNKTSEDKYMIVWDEYIKGDKIKELKELYNNFKRGVFIQKSSTLIEFSNEQSDILKKNVNIRIDDYPHVKPTDYYDRSHLAYKRSIEVVNNALAFAHYKCEAECQNKLFLRKNGEFYYTEAHHLIPLSYQEHFDFSLDVEANVISLCPNCHCNLHYGFDIEEVLRKLFENRKTRLQKCGLDINYENLLLLYR